MRQHLKNQYSQSFPEAGCDEAGRGCLAGPVFAAAVILPEHPEKELIEVLNDSKKLSVAQREYCRQLILDQALASAVASVDVETIDQINILNASILAMHQALGMLQLQPLMILVDGNRFHPYQSIPHSCIIRGDSLYLSIAAASVLAKTCRDAYMEQIHNDFPGYDWIHNKGYPTPRHRKAIQRLGLTTHHRRSFKLYPQLRLNFEKHQGK